MSAAKDSSTGAGGSKPPQRQTNKEPGAFKSLVAGGVGGICLVITGHPLDTIKVGVAWLYTRTPQNCACASAGNEWRAVVGLVQRTVHPVRARLMVSSPGQASDPAAGAAAVQGHI